MSEHHEIPEEIPEGFACIRRGSAIMLVPDPPQRPLVKLIAERLGLLVNDQGDELKPEAIE